MNTLGERLVYARKARGYKTQEELAAATENVVTRNTIANIESGRYNAQPPVIELLCRTLNIEKDWLINGGEEMPEPPEDDICDILCRKFIKLTERDRLIVLDTVESMLKHSTEE